ncbi:MAG: CHAT domain-containing protein [Planctomycetota bacterium]
MRVLCLLVCVAIFGSGASGLTPTAQSPDSALQELQTLLASQRSAGELSELVYQAVKRGPSGGDDEGEWRRALEATVVGGRFPREVPIVLKRLTESFERVGDLRNGIRTMHRLEAALAEPSWTQSRQLAYVRARLRRNAGEYVAANLEYVALAEQRPPSGLSEEEVDLDAWLSGVIRTELIVSCFETGQLRFAARLASEDGDLITRARVSSAQHRYSRTLAYLDEYESGGRTDRPVMRAFERGVARWRLGQPAEARRSFEEVLANTRASHSYRSTTQVFLGRLAVEAGDLELARKMLRALGDSEDVGPLLEVRVRTLEYRVSATTGADDAILAAHRERIRSQYREWLDVWRTGPLVPSGLEFLAAQNREEVLHDVIEAELDGRGGIEAALQRVLDAQSCGTTARRLGAKPRTVDELQAQLRRAGGGAIVVAPGRGATYVFDVDATSVRLSRGATRTELADEHASIERIFRRLDADDELPRLAGTLTKRLFPAQMRERVQGWAKIRFSGLDFLTPIPAAMLRTTDGKWLGETAEVTEWPSVVVALELLQRPAERRDGGLALIEAQGGAAHTTLTKKRGDLPFSAEERERLRKALGDRAQIFSGPEAGRDALSRSTGGVAYLHCHGALDAASARPGRLLLGDATPTSSADIERLLARATPPDHVILAACGAGRGKRTLGEDGADHLGAAFLIAGAGSVVMPSIDVFHGPTKELSLLHLEGLARGETVGESLRNARRAMLARGTSPLDVLTMRLVGAAE